MSGSFTSQSVPGHSLHPLQLSVIIPRRLSPSLSYSHEYAHPHTNQWICDNYKFLRLAAIQFQIHSDHVGRNCYCLRVTEMSLKVPTMIMYPSTLALYISHCIFFFCYFILRRDNMSTHFSVDGSLIKNDPVLLSFLLSAEIILHHCQLQRISFWVKRRKMCSAIAAVTSGFYSRCEKTSLCVYLSPGPRISQAGSFAASAPRPICCRSAQAAGRREARERSQKLTSAIVSYSHCAW